LLALWVAAQTSGEHRITMAALGVFLVTVALLEGVTIIALAWLNNVYDDVTGRERVERRSPWLRAMSEEAEGHISQRVGISLPERIVMINRLLRCDRVRRLVRVLRLHFVAALLRAVLSGSPVAARAAHPAHRPPSRRRSAIAAAGRPTPGRARRRQKTRPGVVVAIRRGATYQAPPLSSCVAGLRSYGPVSKDAHRGLLRLRAWPRGSTDQRQP
jgi:hypothetical protein